MSTSTILVVALFIGSFGLASMRAQTAAVSTEATSAFERCTKILKFGPVHSGSEPSKGEAVLALGLLADMRAVPLLVEHLENESNDHLRLQIVRALGWLGNAAAVSALEKTLSDRYPFVRQQSAAALRKITGKDYEFDKTGMPVRGKGN